MRILVTGGAGFIGSALVRYLMRETAHSVMNIDKLTYAGNLDSLSEIAGNARYTFIQADIADASVMSQVFKQFRPEAIMHLAAESHVDRSITGPGAFIHTNIVGTYTLLTCARTYWEDLPATEKNQFRFHHISTDEVFGSLGETGHFTEETPYDPRSPYSASKASSDHLVRAWHHTYGLPILVTNCSNNYGPYQFPEKLIPVAILRAMKGESIPVYGNGLNIRDWLYVDDHVRALMCVLEHGLVGETYNIGGHNEHTNIDIVNQICRILDKRFSDKAPHARWITFVSDRLGHDLRYAIDSGKIQRELGWVPLETFESGLEKTVDWYISHIK